MTTQQMTTGWYDQLVELHRPEFWCYSNNLVHEIDLTNRSDSPDDKKMTSKKLVGMHSWGDLYGPEIYYYSDNVKSADLITWSPNRSYSPGNVVSHGGALHLFERKHVVSELVDHLIKQRKAVKLQETALANKESIDQSSAMDQQSCPGLFFYDLMRHVKTDLKLNSLNFVAQEILQQTKNDISAEVWGYEYCLEEPSSLDQDSDASAEDWVDEEEQKQEALKQEDLPALVMNSDSSAMLRVNRILAQFVPVALCNSSAL
jgi:hypothetical protein